MLPPPPPFPSGSEWLLVALLFAAGLWLFRGRRVGFAVASAIGVGLFIAAPEKWFYPAWIERANAVVLALLTGDAAEGSVLVGSNYRFPIFAGCVGLRHMALLAALTLAVPGPVRRRVIRTVAGLAGFVVLNLARELLLLQIALRAGLDAYAAVHDLSGVMMTACAALVWALLLRPPRRRDASVAAAPAP